MFDALRRAFAQMRNAEFCDRVRSRVENIQLTLIVQINDGRSLRADLMVTDQGVFVPEHSLYQKVWDSLAADMLAKLRANLQNEKST